MQNTKNFVLIIALAVFFAVLYQIFNQADMQSGVKAISYSEFTNSIQNGEIQSATIMDRIVEGEYKTGSKFMTQTTGDPALADRLVGEGVAVKIRPRETGGFTAYLLQSIVPIILLVVLWFYVMRQMQGGGKGGGGALSTTLFFLTTVFFTSFGSGLGFTSLMDVFFF